MKKKAVLTYLRYHHSVSGGVEHTTKMSVSILYLGAEVWIRDVWNTKRRCKALARGVH